MNSKLPYPKKLSGTANSMTSSVTNLSYEDSTSHDSRPYIESENTSSNNFFEYGEPLRAQHLSIDFTPIPGVDDHEELLQKCVSFWEFVKTTPQLKQMMVVPIGKKEQKLFFKSIVDDIMKRVEEKIEDVQFEHKDKSAVEWIEELPMHYFGKVSLKYCPEFTVLYDHTSGNVDSKMRKKENHSWTMKQKRDVIKVALDTANDEEISSKTSKFVENTLKICAEMEEFDHKHPKSFDPPLPVPNLQTAVMQRLPPLSCPPISAD